MTKDQEELLALLEQAIATEKRALSLLIELYEAVRAGKSNASQRCRVYQRARNLALKGKLKEAAHALRYDMPRRIKLKI